MKELVIVILLIAASGLSYGQSKEEQQIIHGAGGCTPNFSTGGCL